MLNISLVIDASISMNVNTPSQKDLGKHVLYLNMEKETSAKDEYSLGCTYNRKKQFKLALYHLNKAKSLGFNRPSLYLELGMANLQEMRIEESISNFQSFNTLEPGNYKIYSILGRLYGLVGKKQLSEHYLKRAEEDETLKPAIRRFRKQSVNINKTLSTDSDEAPWSISASLSGGYNSNVLILGNDFVLPPWASGKASPYTELYIYGYNIFSKNETSNLRILYQYLGDFYENISSLNWDEPTISLEFNHKFTKKLFLSLNIEADNSWLGGQRYSSFNSASPALFYALDNWNTLELGYSYSNQNFFLPTTAVQNRDGFLQHLTIDDFVTFPSSNLTFAFGYSANWSNTKGSDFSFSSDNFSFGAKLTFTKEISVRVLYSYGMYYYKNLNSLSGFGDGSFKRKDNTNGYSLKISKALNKQKTLSCQYNYFNDNSNIQFYSYTQYIVSLTLTANWG